MDVYALDKDLNDLGHFEFINLQWNRKYYDVGDFEIYMVADQFDPNTRFIVTDERDELGIVYKIKAKKTVKGSFVTLSGYFAEKIYDYTINWPALYDIYGDDSGHSNHKVQLKNLITTSIPYVEGGEDPPLMMLHTDWQGFAPDHKGEGGQDNENRVVYDLRPGTCANPNKWITIDWDYKPNGEGIREKLKTLGMSYRLRYNRDMKFEYVDIWKGKDRTQDNTAGNDPVVFSDENPAVLEFTYERDESGLKDLCETHYGSDTNKDYYRHDGYRHTRNGNGLFDGDEYDESDREMAFDGRRWVEIKHQFDGTHGDIVEDELEHNKMLDDERVELSKHKTIEKAEVEVAQEEGFMYREDYDLGDLCTIVSHQFGVSFNQRITEVHEVWKQNQHLVNLVFGEQNKTVYRRSRDFTEEDRRATRYMYTHPWQLAELWQTIYEEPMPTER